MLSVNTRHSISLDGCITPSRKSAYSCTKPIKLAEHLEILDYQSSWKYENLISLRSFYLYMCSGRIYTVWRWWNCICKITNILLRTKTIVIDTQLAWLVFCYWTKPRCFIVCEIQILDIGCYVVLVCYTAWAVCWHEVVSTFFCWKIDPWTSWMLDWTNPYFLLHDWRITAIC